MSRHVPPDEIEVFALATGRAIPVRRFRGDLVKDDGHATRGAFNSQDGPVHKPQLEVILDDVKVSNDTALKQASQFRDVHALFPDA